MNRSYNWLMVLVLCLLVGCSSANAEETLRPVVVPTALVDDTVGKSHEVPTDSVNMAIAVVFSGSGETTLCKPVGRDFLITMLTQQEGSTHSESQDFLVLPMGTDEPEKIEVGIAYAYFPPDRPNTLVLEPVDLLFMRPGDPYTATFSLEVTVEGEPGFARAPNITLFSYQEMTETGEICLSVLGGIETIDYVPEDQISY